jgi:hypothetical protein
VPPTDRSSISRRAATLVAAGLLATLTGACSSAASPPPTASPLPPASGDPAPSTIAHPMGAGEVVIRYDETGGFAGPQRLPASYPSVSVYGDGTVITLGPIPAIFPGPALPNLVATKLTEAGLQRLLAAAGTAGLLGPDAQYDATGIADATTTGFTVVAGGSRHRVTAYALGFSTPEQEGGAANIAARTRLRAFAQVLGDLRRTFADDIVGPDAPFRYTSITILAAPGAPKSTDPTVKRPPLAWPLSTPLASFGRPGKGEGVMESFRCGVVTGADLETLRPLLAQATQITGWTSGGEIYTLILAPSLPDESSC